MVKLTPLAAVPDTRLKEFLAQMRGGTCAHYRERFDADLVAAYYWEEFVSVRSRSDANGVVALEGGVIVGLGLWHTLPWDSRILGYPCARIWGLHAPGGAVALELLRTMEQEQHRLGIRHCSIRLPAQELHLIQVCEEHEFILVDGLLTFIHYGNIRAASKATTSPDITVALAQEADVDQVVNIAKRSFLYDRFHADPAITAEVADRLHAEWARESCFGNAADAVSVARHDWQVIGFMTCRLDNKARSIFGQPIGTIVLVATAAHARGRGVARCLTEAAVEWCNSQGAMLVQVGTQLSNVPASRLYLSCGFDLVASSLSMRIVYEDNEQTTHWG